MKQEFMKMDTCPFFNFSDLQARCLSYTACQSIRLLSQIFNNDQCRYGNTHLINCLWVFRILISLTIPHHLTVLHDGEEHGTCYGVKRGSVSRSRTSPNPQTPTTNLHQSKTQITYSNCVRGRFWGMHRIDFVLASNLRFLTVR